MHWHAKLCERHWSATEILAWLAGLDERGYSLRHPERQVTLLVAEGDNVPVTREDFENRIVSGVPTEFHLWLDPWVSIVSSCRCLDDTRYVMDWSFRNLIRAQARIACGLFRERAQLAISERRLELLVIDEVPSTGTEIDWDGVLLHHYTPELMPVEVWASVALEPAFALLMVRWPLERLDGYFRLRSGEGP